VAAARDLAKRAWKALDKAEAAEAVADESKVVASRLARLYGLGKALEELCKVESDYCERLSHLNEWLVKPLRRLLDKESTSVCRCCATVPLCVDLCPVVPNRAREVLTPWAESIGFLLQLHMGILRKLEATELQPRAARGLSSSWVCFVLQGRLDFLEQRYRDVVGSEKSVVAWLRELRKWHPNIEQLLANVEHAPAFGAAGGSIAGRKQIAPAYNDRETAFERVLEAPRQHLGRYPLMVGRIASDMPASHPSARWASQLAEAMQTLVLGIDRAM